MASLFDSFNDFDINSPQGHAIMTIAANLLAARDQPGASLGGALGRSALAGMGAYGEAVQGQKRKKLQDMQMQQYEQQLADAAEARSQKQAIQGAFKKALAPKIEGGLTAGGLLSGDYNPDYKPEYPSQKQIQQNLFQELSQIAPEQALQYLPQAPKVKQYMEIAGPQGEKLYQGVDEQGQMVGQPMNAYMQPVQVNTGSSVRFEVPRAGLNIPVGMSPAERDASARGWANVNIAKQNAAGGKPQWDATRGQFIFAPTADAPMGRAVAPAGIIGSQKPASEGERTAAGYLGRMQAAEQVLSAPGAEAPYLANMLPFVTPGGFKANLLNSDKQQQYEQAQMDWVRSKLRKESGAVIGEDEMAAEIRTYFPMPGDSPNKIAQKARARKQAEQQMQISAGGAYRPQQGGGQDMPDDISQILNKYGQGR